MIDKFQLRTIHVEKWTSDQQYYTVNLHSRYNLHMTLNFTKQ